MEQKENNTALLVMDMQTIIVSNLPTASSITESVAKAISYARDNKMPIIYSVVGFRDGMPEISMNNKSFAASKERFASLTTNDQIKIETSVSPSANDIVVVKRRFSAFTGSDLEVLLRAQGIRHIVLTGISTSGVVLSTTREAADKDYQITILSDACGDADEEVHQLLMTKVFPRQADVLTVEEWRRQ